MIAKEDSWLTGSGIMIEFDDMLDAVESYVGQGGKIFIGTDSSIGAKGCTFVTAVCLHGAPETHGGRYFFHKARYDISRYKNLKVRIMQEVQSSIEIALHVIDKNPMSDVEIHLDIGTSERSQTRVYVDELTGWTQAVGFSCKVKPDAWASAAIADRHTK